MDQKTDTPKTAADLEHLYTESESCDAQVFAEMRSNLLLVAGEHYSKYQSAFFRRVRDSKHLNEQQKIRLTKNHIQRITKTYANNILSSAPGVAFTPKNEAELQDQKAAELHHSVWQDARERYSLDEKIDEWCDDFIGVGEVAVKIFWDPDGGKVKAYQQASDETGAPLFEDGEGNAFPTPWHPETLEPLQPKAGEPVYEGAFVFETIYGFNLLRAPEAKTMQESRYVIIRKMMDKDHLTAKYPQFEGKIATSVDQTMVVFDPSRGGYHKSDKQVMIREYYFKPCKEYPRGYYYIATKDCKLEEGELPGGEWPIVFGKFEGIQTTPRGRSAVKQMRPYQAEINRAASKIAEHQITLGDDKLIIQNGTKISAGIALPGVRAINVQGAAPQIMQGRDGSQYLAYLTSQIEELYSVMMVAESEEEASGQLDPYAMLFRAASQKKKFQRYIKRFERFLVDLAKLYVRLARVHLPNDQIIYAIGRKEMVNISEFKNSTDICYQIKVEPQADDIETKMGKQLVLNHLVQYTGAQLSKEDIGKLVRLMPYANMEEGMVDLTLDYDCSTNDILALDRGELPAINQYDNHVYCIKRAVSRMRQPDFKSLNPAIQQRYEQYVMGHQQAEASNIQQIQMAEQGFIPTGGYLVVVDFYVADPQDPAKTRRARIPYEAIKWLIEKLETQGQSLDELEKMNHGALAQMAQQIQGSGGANGMAPQQQPTGPRGAAMNGQPQGPAYQ